MDQKADASDLRALLSKDELDSTAQSIINQLQVFSRYLSILFTKVQELINRQAAHEQSMGEHLKEVGQEVDHRTKDDDFNRFSEEIEKRLRALRKKIEKAGAGGLRDLATEAGAAGFRKQLFNCISCDKVSYKFLNKSHYFSGSVHENNESSSTVIISIPCSNVAEAAHGLRYQARESASSWRPFRLARSYKTRKHI